MKADGPHIYRELEEWQSNKWKHEPNDIERILQSWINRTFETIHPKTKSKYYNRIENFLFYTNAFLQGSKLQKEAREKIVNTARVFNPSIADISSLKELSVEEVTYIAQQHTAKCRFYSAAQGSLTGTGGFLFIGLDFPLLLILNLRLIQLTGLSFGREMAHPHETMLALKVFHMAILPKHLQKAAWNQLHKEAAENNYLYQGKERVVDDACMEQAFKQAAKSLTIFLSRKKLVQGIPVAGITVGMLANLQLTNRIADFSLRFYQQRHLEEILD